MLLPECRYVDGAKAASSILSLDQKNVGALFLRGFCLYHKDNVDRAITHFQQVTMLGLMWIPVAFCYGRWSVCSVQDRYLLVNLGSVADSEP